MRSSFAPFPPARCPDDAFHHGRYVHSRAVFWSTYVVLRLIAHPWLLARLFYLFANGDLPLVSTIDMYIVLSCQTFLIVFNFGLLKVMLQQKIDKWMGRNGASSANANGAHGKLKSK